MEGKEEIIKSIRFSKEEFFLLECCKNKKFSTFIKELLSEYIENQNKIYTNNIDIKKLKEEIKEELKIELLQELRKETQVKEVEIKEEVKTNDPKNEEAKKALFNLMGRR